MTSKHTKDPKNMSTKYTIEYSTIFFSPITGLYIAEVLFPDGTEETMQFQSYEDWEAYSKNINIPTLRYLYANG